jgi:hypothetical protein
MTVSRRSPEVSFLAKQGRLKCLWRELVAQAVIVGSVVLVALGYASPPDPTWIGGIYDDADYDEVVRLVTDRFLIVKDGTVPPDPHPMGTSQSQALALVEYAVGLLLLLAPPLRRPVRIVRGQTTRGPPSDARISVSPCPSPDRLFGRANGPSGLVPSRSRTTRLRPPSSPHPEVQHSMEVEVHQRGPMHCLPEVSRPPVTSAPVFQHPPTRPIASSATGDHRLSRSRARCVRECSGSLTPSDSVASHDTANLSLTTLLFRNVPPV